MLEGIAPTVSSARERVLCRALAAATVIGSLLYFGGFCFVQTWGGDLQIYLAAMTRLYANLLHPMHETIVAPGVQSFTDSPYLMLVAALGRLLGATGYRAMQVAGVCNLVLYVVAAAALFRRHSLHQRWELPWIWGFCASLAVLWLCRRFGLDYGAPLYRDDDAILFAVPADGAAAPPGK